MSKKKAHDSSEEQEPIKHRGSTRKHSPDPEEQGELDEEHFHEMSGLLKPFDAQEWLKDQMRKAPSWAISVAFHVLALACLGLITFSQHIIKAEAPTVITVAAKPKSKVELPERPRGIVDRAGLDKADPVAANEPAIFFPGAEESDHNETDDGEDYGQMKGDSYEFLSALPGSEGGTKGRQPGKGQGVYDAMGVGGGGGGAGRYGGRFGGRRNLVARGGGSQATESAVMAGLRWLARHQSQDGGWHAEAFSQCCAPGTPCNGNGYGQFDAGLTGLSLLAFLGAGYTHLSRETYEDKYTHQKISFGQVVKKGIKYLQQSQDAEGCFGPRTGEFMYNHSIAALAMAEAYGLTNAAQYRPIAQKGIDFLALAQNPYRGWRYSVKPGDNDTSVTGWCIMALKSADISGLTTSKTGYDGAKAWIESVTDDEGQIGYNGKGKIDVVVRGKNEAWGPHPSMTAVGLLCKIFIDKKEDQKLNKHGDVITKDLPRWEEPAQMKPIDFYYWYYGTLAIFQLDGPNGPYWKKWNEAMKDALVKHQKVGKDGCEDGSWDPAVDRWGFAGGRVYATAINVLTLEVYYRYENVFGAGKKRG
jgi:hypothetical protein